MLYTVVPLERVYHNFREDDKPKLKSGDNDKQQTDQTEYREVMLKHGRVVTRRDGDSYVVEKIYSTDMSDYLNKEYAPGKAIRNNETDNKPN